MTQLLIDLPPPPTLPILLQNKSHFTHKTTTLNPPSSCFHTHALFCPPSIKHNDSFFPSIQLIYSALPLLHSLSDIWHLSPNKYVRAKSYFYHAARLLLLSDRQSWGLKRMGVLYLSEAQQLKTNCKINLDGDICSERPSQNQRWSIYRRAERRAERRSRAGDGGGQNPKDTAPHNCLLLYIQASRLRIVGINN
ncbi:hypothetical protein FQA47_013185 [Oryzias melastigma]|uniref:Uncharacterized protein n=1 Tax=Oryzias melastigma TaxID=30732 RepID=A0A834FIB5_ORYME|nr:hypothetical protein FQA47_013185 [Oryzias melastigma]